VNANTFQVWGQKETPQGEQALPMNLGILYMDNESIRRWLMRFDDPSDWQRLMQSLLLSSRVAVVKNQPASPFSTRCFETK
jgi:hypothetical protein